MLWPIWALMEPGSRISGMGHGRFYLGRISIAYLLAFVATFTRRLGRTIRVLSLCTLAMIVLWSFSSGETRYGIPIEIIGGILTVCLLSSVWFQMTSTRTGALGRSVLLLFVGVIALQACLVFRRGVFHKEYYTTDNDWDSIAQPTAISQPLLYAKEAKNIVSDRDPKAFIDRQTARSLAEIEVWINGIWCD